MSKAYIGRGDRCMIAGGDGERFRVILRVGTRCWIRSEKLGDSYVVHVWRLSKV